MADLDGFFAKKDKKKRSKNKKTKDKDRDAGDNSGADQSKQKQMAIGIGQSEESEWVEKEEAPTEIPLEGLKVHSLKTEEDGEKVAQPPPTEAPSEDQKPTKVSSTTAWQTVQAQPELTISSPSNTSVTSTSSSTSSSSAPYVPPAARSGAYVPPGARSGGSSGTYIPPGRRNVTSKAPPDIASDQAFPSLPSAAKTEITKDRTNGRHEDQMYTELKLSNKFSALRTD